MKTYEVVQRASGVALWTGRADSEQDALDRMAREAGYRDHASSEGGGTDTLEVREKVDALAIAERAVAALNARVDKVSARNYTARVWALRNEVRVYVRGSSGDIGYIAISETGERDYAYITRGKADVRNRVGAAL